MKFLPELKAQFRATAKMLTTVMEKCPDELWHEKFGQFCFYEECFHALCYLDLLTQEWKPFSEERFGNPKRAYVDKSWWYKESLICWTETSAGINDHVLSEESFLAMIEEYADFVPEKEVMRALEVLRHTQHHVGKLAAYLELKGIEVKNWE